MGDRSETMSVAEVMVRVAVLLFVFTVVCVAMWCRSMAT